MAVKTEEKSFETKERVLTVNDDCCIDPQRCGRAQTCLLRAALCHQNPELYDENIGRPPKPAITLAPSVPRASARVEDPTVPASTPPRTVGVRRTYENKGTTIRLRGIGGA